jgi:hypothetical protein
MSKSLLISVAIMVLLFAVAFSPVAEAKDYDVVLRDVWAHDDSGPPYNPVPYGTTVEMDCDWYAVDDGETDYDGYYADIYFEDPYPFPDPQDPLQWVSTIDDIPGWEAVGPTTISTDRTVMLHEHVWNGDME